MSYRGKSKGNYGIKHRGGKSASFKSKSNSSKIHDDFTHKSDESNRRTLSEETEETIINCALDSFLRAPIISELHTAYLLADTIYDNWNTITQLYDAYQKKGWDGVAESIDTEIAQDTLASIQTKIVWSIICKCVPAPLQKEGKETLSGIMNKVTSVEVNFVTNLLTKQKVKSKSHVAKQEYPSQKNSTKKDLPDAVEYV